MQTSMQHRIIVNLLLFSNYYAAASNKFDQPKSKLIKNTQQKHRAHQYLKSKSDDDSNLDDIYTSKPISTEIILGLDLDRQVMYFAKFGEKKWGGSTYKEFKQEVAVEGPGKIKGGHDMTEELSEIFGKHDNFAIKTQAMEWIKIPIERRCETYCTGPGVLKKTVMRDGRDVSVADYENEKDSLNCKCKCFEGFEGDRCEISPCDKLRQFKRHHWSYKLEKFQMACGNGTCTLDQNNQPYCRCPPGIGNSKTFLPNPVQSGDVGRQHGCDVQLQECDLERTRTWTTVDDYLEDSDLKSVSYIVRKTMDNHGNRGVKA